MCEAPCDDRRLAPCRSLLVSHKSKPSANAMSVERSGDQPTTLEIFLRCHVGQRRQLGITELVCCRDLRLHVPILPCVFHGHVDTQFLRASMIFENNDFSLSTDMVCVACWSEPRTFRSKGDEQCRFTTRYTVL